MSNESAESRLRIGSQTVHDDNPARVQLGATGPVVIAQLWLEAVIRQRDLRKAWSVTHGDLRRRMARAWVESNANHVALVGRNRAQLVERLGMASPDDPLWPGFEATTLDECAETWAHVDLDSWGWASAPRVVSPSRELVYLVDISDPNVVLTDGRYVVDGDEGDEVAVPGEGFILEYIEGAETDDVHVVAGESRNLWRLVDFERFGAADQGA